MYTLRLGLLAVCCVSALNAGEFVVLLTSGGDMVATIVKNPHVQHAAMKKLVNNYSVVDQLPKGLTDNCVTNNKYVKMVISKQDVDCFAGATALEVGTTLKNEGVAGFLKTEERKRIGTHVTAAVLLTKGYNLLSSTRLAPYIKTDSQIVNDSAYALSHGLLSMFISSKIGN